MGQKNRLNIIFCPITIMIARFVGGTAYTSAAFVSRTSRIWGIFSFQPEIR